ncbi:radical SAM protein [Parazoarcus communis]|uniref:Radical SAM protein n=1 Tax=Parazoarcus communis SWub3 = DSM 12120 TaxID=1121029 RepID=A0A323UVL9_9RHOO|nr:radical SAM protein [Parazoarcus communis]NMG71566.1 radical SAM protein [Parazoarcus communis SWub3 = DSM 12120]PZA16527.1 radical SAM protein [Azoarcus communis] [Parazoarcus communis SWub3 = DSM 12120]
MISTIPLLTISNHDRDLAGLTYVYPVLSRRAGGVSVGINLNPNNACNWHCAYCQVPGLVRGKAPVIDLAVLEAELSGFLSALVRGDWLAVNAPEGMRQIRDIAFSGNGEPTSAEAFTAAIDVVVRLRAAFGLDDVPLRLITNGSLMAQARVQAGLDRLAAAGGEVWFKVDAGEAAAIERINGVSLDPQALSRHLSICAAHCPTWVQTCMFRWDGEVPSAAFIDAYLEVLLGAGPERLQGVLLYGIARPSMQVGASHLSPLSAVELEQIADRIKQKGLTVRVSP